MDGSGTPDRVDGAAHAREPVDILGISKRLQKDPRWLTVIEPLRTQMIRECRQKGMSKADAQAWTYSELDRLYPPEDTDGMPVSDSQSETAHCGRVTGLSDIPSLWPTLPANASLAAEISWVQASRLDVVEERPNGSTVVHLDRADSPAPSKAALGWLETSIRSYAKYVDVAAKATAQQQDEQEAVRREKLAIDQLRGLLAEMVPGPPCPTCGQSTPSDWEQLQA